MHPSARKIKLTGERQFSAIQTAASNCRKETTERIHSFQEHLHFQKHKFNFGAMILTRMCLYWEMSQPLNDMVSTVVVLSILIEMVEERSAWA